MVESFKTNMTHLSERGFKTVLNIMNNVTSKAIKNYLYKEDIKIQIVEPHNHQANTSEIAIQTSQNISFQAYL